MTLLQDITTAALLGTERQAFTPTPESGPLGDLLARLPADPEAALLGAAALASLHQRAGALPAVIDAARPAPCPPDDQPVCSRHVSQGLAVMLGGAYREALPEMLAALAAVGRRVPETLLPELLKQGRQSKELREFILPVLGRRGQWLAAQNREWAYADQLLLETAESPERVWAEGSREARLSALASLRETDPAAGLALLQTTWATETADDRAAFASALGTGLSLADEPFLEAALDDRGKDVRRAAADLLARLPGSLLGKRMMARAEPLITWKRRLLRAAEIEVSLPEDCDASLKRDGVEVKPPFAGLGEKAWWLAQVLAAVPPGHWSAKWGQSPADVLEAITKNEWKQALLTGWQGAVKRFGDEAWAEALTTYYLRQKVRVPNEVLSAWERTDPARVEAFLLKTLRASPEHLQGQGPVLSLLQGITGIWSADLSRTVVESIQHSAAQENTKDGRLWSLTHLLRGPAAFHTAPALADELSRGWPEAAPQWEFWQPHVHEFRTALHFRHDLLVQISQEARP